jgi:hypothetical protein
MSRSGWYRLAISGKRSPGFRCESPLSGFALPVLRYFVGASESQAAAPLALISPVEGATVDSVQSPLFKWVENQPGSFVRLEIADRNEKTLLNSILPAGAMSYRAPSWLRDKAVDRNLRWRVVMFDQTGRPIAAAPWRRLRFVRAGGAARQ